jgi:hypothetical protein
MDIVTNPFQKETFGDGKLCSTPPQLTGDLRGDDTPPPLLSDDEDGEDEDPHSVNTLESFIGQFGTIHIDASDYVGDKKNIAFGACPGIYLL